MSRHDWRKLIKRYADDRVICNCGEAYYTEIDGHMVCNFGCSANLIRAKEYIAERVMEELPDVPSEP